MRHQANREIKASYFCFPCTLAQMETEVKDRAAQAHLMGGNTEGYSQHNGGMVYGQQPNQPAMAYQRGPHY